MRIHFVKGYPHCGREPGAQMIVAIVHGDFNLIGARNKITLLADKR